NLVAYLCGSLWTFQAYTPLSDIIMTTGSGTAFDSIHFKLCLIADADELPKYRGKYCSLPISRFAASSTQPLRKSWVCELARRNALILSGTASDARNAARSSVASIMAFPFPARE